MRVEDSSAMDGLTGAAEVKARMAAKAARMEVDNMLVGIAIMLTD